MSLKQFLLAIRARFAIVVLVLVAAVCAGTTISLLLPKKYTATAAVVIDVKSPDPVYGTLLHAMVMPGYMATQRDIIASERVAHRAARLLNLHEDAERKARWLESTRGRGSFDVWLADSVQKGLEVRPLRESNVIEISYSSSEPQFAAAVANAVARAYIDASLALRVEPAKQYALWFGQQDQLLRESLEKAQARLSAHQQKYGIVVNEERLDSEQVRLNDLSAQLTVVQAQLADSRSRQRSGSAASTLPEVLQNPVIQGLKGDIARQEAKLHEASGNLGGNHPEYRRMQFELAALRQRLEAETRHIASGFGTASAVSQDKAAELAAAVAAQKKKVLALRQARDELGALQRDLDIAQKAYESVSQRLTQSRLESQFTQTNVSVLALAAEPLAPSFPNIPVNVLLAIVVGSICGVAAAFLLEMLDRRIRCAEDVGYPLQLPLLGRIPRRRRPPRPALSYRNRLAAPK